MLQVNYIRQNADLVKERLSAKYFADVLIVDRIIALDEQVRKLKVESETLQASQNAASKEIGMLKGG
jgi:seryl-tRNA synthetase